MALPPILIAKREPVRLVSPMDPAIDTSTPEGRAALDRYLVERDPSVLLWCASVQPTWFVLRALTTVELRILRREWPAMPAGVGEWQDRMRALQEDLDAAKAEERSIEEIAEAIAAHNNLPARQHRLDWYWLVGNLYLRAALVAVEGLEGWTARREPFGAVSLWPEHAILALDDSTSQFLGQAALSLSSLSSEKKSASGS